MTQCQKSKLVESSTAKKQELIEHIEGLAMRGVKTAILLAQLGDESSLAEVTAASLLAIKRGENLLRAIDAVDDETIS